MFRRFFRAKPSLARSPLGAVLLAAALLLGQLGLIAHAADHALHPDRPVCQLCVHAHTGACGQIVPAVSAPPLIAERPQVPLRAIPHPVPHSIYGARAPPV